ncbi:CHAT domain-containing protein [Paraburkholderia sp. MM5384-R2]|uniref:CHAT domain-containing protein n=1 Tax=Paraburkholderia sp. MM5384-R2 TaxID=2723097 RepID=UPI0016191804|nr:CHAT domain-containing protein [Paraburkholderia sp. MM5384-R2]MBB5503414.1 hypothetical protein [Paraburkholderia sp. MM5384-R2]
MNDAGQVVKYIWARLDNLYLRASTLSADDRRRTYELLVDKTSGRGKLAEHLHLLCDFEQFVIATTALSTAMTEGEVSEMGDWIQWSLTDKPTDHFVHSMETGRIARFWMSPVLRAWPGFYPVMVTYFSALYDYARKRSAIKEICELFWEASETTFSHLMSLDARYITGPEVWLGCSMLCWAGKESFDRAKAFTPAIEAQAARTELSSALRSMFVLALATTGGRFSTKPSREWAELAITEFDAELSSISRSQMYATALMGDGGSAEAEVVLEKMRATQEERLNHLEPMPRARQAAQTMEFVHPYFVRCMDLADASLVIRGLQVWYQQTWPDDPLDPDTVLLMLPFGKSGSSLLVNGKMQVIMRDTQAALERLAHANNAFLGTYSTVAYADNSTLEIPDRPGVPREYQRDYREALLDAYCPDGFEVNGNPEAQLMLHTEGHPIQAMQLIAWGRTWPITSSLGRPRPDRRIRSVLIWGGGTITEPMETAMVQHAFEVAGAKVKVMAPLECEPGEFLREYANPEYDLIWVASHGEFNHWSPHQVTLHLTPEKTSVDLQELWSMAPMTAGRRLLVLNICDGARFAETGLLPRIGLAPGLASPAQATISHLWPVQPYPSAAFGAYLAHYLSSGGGYFDSYLQAVSSLAKMSSEAGYDLEKLYGKRFELIERLACRQQDFTNLEVWGSAAFFQ